VLCRRKNEEAKFCSVSAFVDLGGKEGLLFEGRRAGKAMEKNPILREKECRAGKEPSSGKKN